MHAIVPLHVCVTLFSGEMFLLYISRDIPTHPALRSNSLTIQTHP